MRYYAFLSDMSLLTRLSKNEGGSYNILLLTYMYSTAQMQSRIRSTLVVKSQEIVICTLSILAYFSIITAHESRLYTVYKLQYKEICTIMHTSIIHFSIFLLDFLSMLDTQLVHKVSHLISHQMKLYSP